MDKVKLSKRNISDALYQDDDNDELVVEALAEKYPDFFDYKDKRGWLSDLEKK